MKCACLENFQKKILSPKICVEIFEMFEKILSTKMCVEMETYTICYMHEMCVFRKFSGKNSKSKNMC